MTTLSVSSARKDLLNIIEKADKNLEEFTITKNGSPKAVIISAEEFESWKETVEILGNEALMRKIENGMKDIKAGNIVRL